MQFPEKEIFNDIQTELTAKAAYLTGLTHPAVAHVDWDRGQYEEANETGDFPFLRPGVFVLFGEIKVEGTDRRPRINIPLTITVVQDKYVDPMQGSSSQTAYLKMLEYKWLINDILTGMQGSCFTELYLSSVNTDHENRNLHVERLNYTVKATLKRTLIP